MTPQKYVTILFCFLYQLTYTQVKTYDKVDKIYRDTYNFLESASNRGKQYKDKGKYIVYSDRDDNVTYLDALGLKLGEKQAFLTPYYVIDETSDFLEVVKFDTSIIGKPKGVFSFFYGNQYTFKDVKNVQYVGWIPKNKLLHFSHSKVSEANLKPLTYFLGINDNNTLFELRKYIEKDSIKTYTDPSLKNRAKKSFNTNQMVYVYKYNVNKTAALIANTPHLQATDSLNRIMGWVSSKLIKKIGQRKVFKIDNGIQEKVIFKSTDTTRYAVKDRNINHDFLFRKEETYQQQQAILDSSRIVTYTPLYVWDHYDNKLINVKGGDVYLREVPTLKAGKNTFNFHFIFDCSENLKDQLALQIGSLQRIWLLLNEDERFKGKKITFSASSYGCGKDYYFPKSNSFALWLDYLQKVFQNDPSLQNTQNSKHSIEKCFENVIADYKNGMPQFENNIVIIIGEDNLNIGTRDPIFEKLAKKSSHLLFFQLKNSANNNHQDYVLKAKQILDIVGNYYSDYIANYIIENDLVTENNIFKTIPSEESNIYLFDASENSMYTGGIVFPKIDQSLTPFSFDIAIDSLLDTTIKRNNLVIESLEKGVDNLGFLRSKPAPRIINLLAKDTIDRNSILIPKTNKFETFLETSKLNLKDNPELESGYLFTKAEFEFIIESYRSFIPLTNDNVSKKERKKLYRKYKSYYKELNKLLFYKDLNMKKTVDEMIQVKTGVRVSNSFLKNLKIRDIKKKCLLPNENYVVLMKNLRQKIDDLEEIISNETTVKYVDTAGTVFYYISEKKLL